MSGQLILRRSKLPLTDIPIQSMGLDLMTMQEEAYIHLVDCADSLNQAWCILGELRVADLKGTLWRAAFSYALIAYAKPYKVSFGNSTRRHILDERFVPAEFKELHKKNLSLRDQVLAHSDLTIKDAHLHARAYGSGQIVTVVSNHIDPLFSVGSIDDVLRLLERTLDGLYKEIVKVEAALSRTA